MKPLLVLHHEDVVPKALEVALCHSCARRLSRSLRRIFCLFADVFPSLSYRMEQSIVASVLVAGARANLGQGNIGLAFPMAPKRCHGRDDFVRIAAKAEVEAQGLIY